MVGEVITIEQLTGATPTYNEVTAIRFCSDDNHNPGLSTPCKVPPALVAAYYSYWISLCLNYSGDFALINNMRFWGPGNIAATWFPGSKGRMVAGRHDTGDHGFLTSAYQRSAGTSGLTGYAIKDAVNGHASFKDETALCVDVDTLDEDHPLVIDSRNIETEGQSKCILLQTECYPGAGHGEMTQVLLVFAVDVV
jgi:hypothetical protein